jgi:phosphohistidine phosphatase
MGSVDALLYLMRHGAAEDTAPTGRDADRRLTVAGRVTVERVALALRGSGERSIGHVIASPFVRAQETAEIMRAILCPHVDIDTDEDLTPDGSAYDLAARLCSARLDTLLVGHQPNIEMVARALIARPSYTGPQAAPTASRPSGAPARLPPGFRTATVVAFQVEGRPPPYALALTIDPSALPDV